MSNMEDCTGSKPATRPEAANANNSNETPGAPNTGGSNAESSRPMLSLVSPSPANEGHVEEGFFAKGAADDKAAMEMYAAMLPRGYNLGRINPRYFMIAGAAVLLLVGVAAGRHLPGGHSSGAVTAPPAEASPTVAPAPAPAAAVPAAPAPSAEMVAAPAPAPVVAAPEATAPAPAVAAPEAPTGASVEAIAAAPTPPAEAAPAANQEAPAPAPAVAAAPAEQPAQPEKSAAPAAVAPAPAVVAPEPAVLPVAEVKPAEAAPAQPATDAVPAEAKNVQACREAIKKRDIKAVSTQCEAALATEASLAKPLLAFAKAQFEKGKSAQAAVWARKIAQVNNSLADAYLIMGAAEQEAHHAAAAKTAYQRYLELAPKGAYADDVRSSLKSL